MVALSKCLVGCVLFTLGPVPPDAPPDPTGKGYMGVWFAGSGEAGSLAIDRVEPGKPAEQAGIRAGDVIVRVGKLAPKGSQQVIDHVMMFRPGATLEIEVRRGSETKAFNLKLAERPPDNVINRVPVLVEP
jgi:S1-C subfamily serine protease